MMASWLGGRIVTRGVLAAGAALVAVLPAGCGGGSTSSYFLLANSSEVLLVQWPPPQDGQANGTITVVTIGTSMPADTPGGGLTPSLSLNQTVSIQTGNAVFAVSGSQVTVTPDPSSPIAQLGQFVPGTLSGGTLTFTPGDASGQIQTIRLQSSNVVAYDQAVAALRRNVAGVNVDTDVRRIDSDAGALPGDTGAFGSTVQAAATNLSIEKSNTAGEPAYVQLSPGDCDDIVTSDAGFVFSFAQDMETDVGQLGGYISTVRSEIRQLDDDLATLRHFGLKPPGNTQAAIDKANQDIGTAVSQANAYIGTFNGYQQQAYSIASKINGTPCSGGRPASPSAVPAMKS